MIFDLFLFSVLCFVLFFFSVWFPCPTFFLEWAVRNVPHFLQRFSKKKKLTKEGTIDFDKDLRRVTVRVSEIWRSHFAVEARALPPADLRLPLFRSKFFEANSIVLNSENVGYKTQWNWSQNKTRRRMFIYTFRQFRQWRGRRCLSTELYETI